MERPMAYVLNPSLKDRALIKTAVTLWSQIEISAFQDIPFCFTDDDFLHLALREMWQAIEDEVLEKIPEVPLPESLKKELVNVIKPIGHEILRWRKYHYLYYYNNYNPAYTNKSAVIDRIHKLCWSPQGTVDVKRTAEALIKDESLDIGVRYKMACLNCLENDIKILWNRMPPNVRKSFYSEEHPSHVKQQFIVIYWTYIIKGEVARLSRGKFYGITPQHFAFKVAAVDDNKIAAQYFLEKLSPKERGQESLLETATNIAENLDQFSRPFDLCPFSHYDDSFCFLLTQLDESQQQKVFSKHLPGVLNYFLYWPMQGFFIETVKRVWDFLSEEHYKCLLEDIVHKVVVGYKDHNYQKLFANLWQQSPIKHKMFVINTCNSGHNLLAQLFQAEDMRNITLILKNATVEQKESCFRESVVWNSFIRTGDSKLLGFFVNECISSKEKLIEFREEFIKCFLAKSAYKDTWYKFIQFMDDFIQNYDKRNLEDGDPLKRLCKAECRK